MSQLTVNRMKGRTQAWFSKPANVILLVFLIVLTVLTLYPMVSMLSETTLVHLGREARMTKLAAGNHTFFHFKRLFATAENDYSWITFYQPLLNTLVVSISASAVMMVVSWLKIFFMPLAMASTEPVTAFPISESIHSLLASTHFCRKLRESSS